MNSLNTLQVYLVVFDRFINLSMNLLIDLLINLLITILRKNKLKNYQYLSILKQIYFSQIKHIKKNPRRKNSSIYTMIWITCYKKCRDIARCREN